ncbi:MULTISPECIES: RES family NAD+ phosphorylase [unclassified Bradyrhizobium]|uniref:RES family NAD+ phosphorylase n=1 Tax=unclassified Bradyrhizobium TaxID=2631580 RepID=UPI002915DE1D|nr:MULTISPECIES: RES family NAD+ phosphorylase [unclassified Bradyrhizobium]
MYETRFPDPLGYGPGLNRFSDPTGKAFGVVYLGSSAKVAFVETILRDRADGRGATCVVSYDEIEKRSLASIVPVEPLILVDLTGDGPLRMGIPSDVVGARDQSLAQRWSAAFHDHPETPDGVLYPSRLNEERCIALYARALPKLKAIAAPLLVDCRAELAAILDDLDLAIV